MSYEVRIGLLAAITIAVTVWGYTFMKGKNLLKASNTYYVEYTNIDQLTATSAVLIRGLKVGTVSEVVLSPGLEKITATLDIERGIRLAKGTEALVVSTSIMGGKAVVLNTPGPCTGADCYDPGSTIPGRVQGLFESLIGDSDFNEFVAKAKHGVSEIFGSLTDSLTNENTASEIAASIRDIQMILANVEGITGQLNNSIPEYNSRIYATLDNAESFSGMLAENNETITSTLENLNTLLSDLNEAQIGDKVSNIMESADGAVSSLDSTMAQANLALSQINTLLSNMKDGQGTLGKMLNDDELYTNLNSTAANLDLLLQDFRLNPKRYVNVSVFGKKGKAYVVPEDDPAQQASEPEGN